MISNHLAEKQNAATHNYPFTNDIWILQDKYLVDLYASYSFTPVFLHLCTTPMGSTGKTRFQGGKKMVAIVMLSAEAYATIQAHIENYQSQLRILFIFLVSLSAYESNLVGE